MKRSVIYARTGSEPAMHSIEEQCASANEYAKKHDFAVLKVYTDRGKSGAHIDGRDGMVRLLEDISNPAMSIKAIIAVDLSRLTRSASDFASIASACELAGVEIYCCHGKLPGDVLAGMTDQPAAQTCTNLA